MVNVNPTNPKRVSVSTTENLATVTTSQNNITAQSTVNIVKANAVHNEVLVTVQAVATLHHNHYLANLLEKKYSSLEDTPNFIAPICYDGISVTLLNSSVSRKLLPVADDTILIEDSENSNTAKYIKLGDLFNTLGVRIFNTTAEMFVTSGVAGQLAYCLDYQDQHWKWSVRQNVWVVAF